jgi:beta-lactamase class A
MTSRRDLIAGATALIASGCTSAAPAAAVAQSQAAPKIAAIEQRIGGRIGVFAINTETLTSIAHRHTERFAMASTFKWVLAAQILKMAEAGALKLDQRLGYSSADILPNSPVTQSHVAEGAMSIEALCQAIVTVSDNTAANLLLGQAGGPEGFTKFLRESSDRVTRLDRYELELNENAPGDPRDTTTPMAMALLAERLLVRNWLQPASQRKLHGWLIAATPGLSRLRAGLPAAWPAGDKTGTGGNGAFNDVAIAWPPARRPILIACHMSGSAAPDADKAAGHADIARIIAGEWA